MPDEIIVIGNPPPGWKPAEIIPFPIGRTPLIRQALRESRKYGDPEFYFRRVVKEHRQRLEQIGVAPDRIDVEVAALESAFFPKPVRRRA
jgi:hypothetical protein